MAIGIIRILSDIHFGEPASRVRSLAALRPLFAGADRIVFNGDSLETRYRPSRRMDHLRRHFQEFVRSETPPIVLLTGNHDADISAIHHLDLLGGLVFVTHGEILFDDLVPWSPEQPQICALYREQLAALPAAERELFEPRLAACKRACAQLRLPHDAPPRKPWGRTMHTARKFWPPGRTLAMVRAWRELPERAAIYVRRHRPRARFAVVGHTHLPGVWFRQDIVVINTGSFCPPFASYVVDISPEQVVVRRVRRYQGRYHPGRVVASFALAPASDGSVGSSNTFPEFVPAP
ncbi:MAG TPA: metallophosphoesterase [Opitutaceae bacterium]|nr:metallophosphoesterase [Opitutaceae bacterium]